MNDSLRTCMAVAAIALATATGMAGCATGVGENAGTRHLSAAQCRDLGALRHNAPLTRERNASQMGALEAAGYRPEWTDDPYYPEDLEDALRRVDAWYASECVDGGAG